MNLIFLGAPGSGKGTQASSLVQEFHLAHVSTGDMLRAAVANKTQLGLEAQSFMSAGKLVPDSVVIGIIEERLKASDCDAGVLLDGFPRTVPQAVALSEMFTRMGKKLDKVIYLDVGDEELFTRLSARGRADDTPETVRARLKVYQDQTSPLIDHYTGEGILARIEGVGSVDDIGAHIRAALKA